MSSSDQPGSSPDPKARLGPSWWTPELDKKYREQRNPTARDLLNKLHAMELDNPKSLDLPVACYYEGDWYQWNGELQDVIDFEGNQCVGIEDGPTEQEKAEAKLISEALETHAREESWNRPEVLEAKQKGILP
jgi:hypothetical protein